MSLFSFPFPPHLLKLPCSLSFTYWCRIEEAILALLRDLGDSGLTGAFSLINSDMGQPLSPLAYFTISQVRTLNWIIVSLLSSSDMPRPSLPVEAFYLRKFFQEDTYLL